MTPNEILRRRAQVLAQPLGALVEGGRQEVLEFSSGPDRFALQLTEVAGVFRLDRIGILPGAPPPLVGIATWHGAVLRVLDLRLMVGQETRGLDDQTWVVAVGRERLAFGLLVSHVTGLRTLAGSDVSAPVAGVASDRRFLIGSTNDGTQVLNSAAMHAAFALGESR